MAKKITFDLSKQLKGLNETADLVKQTLGPKGRNVFIMDAMEPKITNDGVTIANSVEFEDPEEESGAYIIKNTSSQTNDNAGDGTTTTAILVQETIREALNYPVNPMEIKASLAAAGEEVVKKIKKLAKPIRTDAQIEQVATLSAESEKHGKMIAEIIKKVGKTGTITVEDSRTFHTDYEIVDGYEANVGFMSPYFITDQKLAKAVFEAKDHKIPVIVFQHKISTVGDIKVMAEVLQAEQIREFVLVCQDLENSMLTNFVATNMSGQIKLLVIRVPDAQLLEDIAAAVDAKIVGGVDGVNYDHITPDSFGWADKVVATEKKSLFFNKKSKKAHLHSKRLEELGKSATNPYEQKKYLERAAKLKGNIAVIRVGAPTDMEKWYLKHKLEDAVNATQSAIEEGVVEGGGMCLFRIAEEMKPKTIGEEILKKVLKSPLKTIIGNAGKDYTEIVLNMPKGKGYNAKKDCYEKLLEKGVIDPAKVERCAVENAVSTGGTFVTTAALLTEIKKDHVDGR